MRPAEHRERQQLFVHGGHCNVRRARSQVAVRALVISRATHRKLIQNLAWAIGYNAIAIPLAAGVAVSVGILLKPAVGALFGSLSTVIVAISAMLLRRIQLD